MHRLGCCPFRKKKTYTRPYDSHYTIPTEEEKISCYNELGHFGQQEPQNNAELFEKRNNAELIWHVLSVIIGFREHINGR
jgi:hypothetical protein